MANRKHLVLSLENHSAPFDNPPCREKRYPVGTIEVKSKCRQDAVTVTYKHTDHVDYFVPLQYMISPTTPPPSLKGPIKLQQRTMYHHPRVKALYHLTNLNGACLALYIFAIRARLLESNTTHVHTKNVLWGRQVGTRRAGHRPRAPRKIHYSSKQKAQNFFARVDTRLLFFIQCRWSRVLGLPRATCT